MFKKKKKTQRIEYLAQQKLDSDLVNKYIKDYNSLSSEDLIKLSKKIIIDLSMLKDFKRLKDLELQYEALINIMEPRNIYTYQSDFINYPDYSNNNFDSKIFYKKEFNFTKTKKLNMKTQQEKEDSKEQLI